MSAILMPTPDIPDWENLVWPVWLQWAKHPKVLLPARVCDGCAAPWPCEARDEAQRKLDEMLVDPYKIMRDFGLTGKQF